MPYNCLCIEGSNVQAYIELSPIYITKPSLVFVQIVNIIFFKSNKNEAIITLRKYRIRNSFNALGPAEVTFYLLLCFISCQFCTALLRFGVQTCNFKYAELLALSIICPQLFSKTVYSVDSSIQTLCVIYKELHWHIKSNKKCLLALSWRK